MAIISKGITLSYKAYTGEQYTVLTNLQSIPELGGESEKIEITTLADAAHVYTEGIKNYGDSITFKFLYEGNQFFTLDSITDSVCWRVSLPDEQLECNFNGKPSVKLDGVGTNAVLTYSLSITPDSELTWDEL